MYINKFGQKRVSFAPLPPEPESGRRIVYARHGDVFLELECVLSLAREAGNYSLLRPGKLRARVRLYCCQFSCSP
jgi:hypothetical protein